jgi:CDP-ribitol ribitolphosphotransferase
MGWIEYLVANSILRFLGAAFGRFPLHRRRVVFATARAPTLEGNLAFVHRAMHAGRPDLEYVFLLEPYSYGLTAKLAYLARLIRGMYYVQTSALIVLDNAYFPVHVMPHRPETTVVQAWHAAGALKRFGLDAPVLRHPSERRFLHRHYDYVVVGGAAARGPYASALGTPVERVLPLGSPRTDFFFDADAVAAARERLLSAFPQLAGRTVVLYAPTFRGAGAEKRAAPGFDATGLRAALPDRYALVLKAHPNLDPQATPRAGYDAVIDPSVEINEVFAVADILVTDYSSSIFEWALLRRPLILLAGDLAQYERDPGMYVDYRRDMVGTRVADTDAVAAAILADAFDLSGYEPFIARHLGASDGSASERFVDRFAPAPRPHRSMRAAPERGQPTDEAEGGQPAGRSARGRLPADVSDQ